MPRLTRKERRKWRMDYKRDVPRDVRRRAARRLNRERRAKRRERIAISRYDRERNGQTEHVRDYEQERSVNGPSPPSMEALNRAEPEPRPYIRPGKFEGGLFLDQFAYNISMEGFGDTTGDVSEFGWVATAIDVDRASMIQAAHDSGEALNDDELHFIDKHPYAIIMEDSVGFVDVKWYDSEGGRDDDFAELEREYEKGSVGDEIEF